MTRSQVFSQFLLPPTTLAKHPLSSLHLTFMAVTEHFFFYLSLLLMLPMTILSTVCVAGKNPSSHPFLLQC